MITKTLIHHFNKTRAQTLNVSIRLCHPIETSNDMASIQEPGVRQAIENLAVQAVAYDRDQDYDNALVLR